MFLQPFFGFYRILITQPELQFFPVGKMHSYTIIPFRNVISFHNFPKFRIRITFGFSKKHLFLNSAWSKLYLPGCEIQRHRHRDDQDRYVENQSWSSMPKEHHSCNYRRHDCGKDIYKYPMAPAFSYCDWILHRFILKFSALPVGAVALFSAFCEYDPIGDRQRIITNQRQYISNRYPPWLLAYLW